MAWVTATWNTGQLVAQGDLNQLRDDLNLLSRHSHGNGVGSGDGGSLIRAAATHVDMRSVVPAPTSANTLVVLYAPGADPNRLLFADGGATGTIYTIVNSSHTHAGI